MKNNAKVSMCLVALILLSTMFFVGAAFAQQQGQGTQSVLITVTDQVTGKAAQGVTTLIQSSSGATVQNLGTVPQGGTTVSLPSGQYNVIVQIALFGFPVTLNSYSFDTTKVNAVELSVSAIFLPMQYVPLFIYIIVAIVILAIVIGVIRRLIPHKKPMTPPAASAANTTPAK